MPGRRPLSAAGKLTVGSLVAAAGGIVMMLAAGVVFQTPIPPGLGILLIPAGLVAFGRWRWTLVISALAGLFIFVSYFPSGAAVRLLHGGGLVASIGLWMQFVASLSAAVAGTVASIRN